MGADSFITKASGRTAKEAFNSAVEKALYEYGHRGYTGTIAEKHDFIMLKVPAGRDPRDYANSDEAQEQVEDKWGPAGCVELGNEEWLFFGVAPS
jgi:hypothetical protein